MSEYSDCFKVSRMEERKGMKCVIGRPDMLLSYIGRTQTAHWLVLLLVVGGVITKCIFSS